MLKLLHTSDLQLDAPFEFMAERGQLHRQQLLQTFKRIVEVAGSGGYDMLLIAGDLFNDNRPSKLVVNSVIQALGGLRIPVCILPGNHDCLDKTSIYRKANFPENVHVLSETPTYLDFPDLDLCIAGNAILTKHSQKSSLAGITRKGNSRWFVILAHGNLQIPDRVKSPERPISASEIQACGADYVALGDWHSFQDYSQGRVKAFYSGAPEAMSFDQKGPGAVASITLSEQGVQVESIRVGTIENGQLSLDMTGLSEQDVIAKIRTMGKPTLMLDVTLRGLESLGHQLDAEQIGATAADDFYWLRITNQAHLQIDKINLGDYPDTQVLGQYVRLLSEKLKAAKDDKEKRISEQALQLGVALLQGEAVLG